MTTATTRKKSGHGYDSRRPPQVVEPGHSAYCAASPTLRHYMMLEPPTKEGVLGTCRYCLLRRRYPHTLDTRYLPNIGEDFADAGLTQRMAGVQ